MLRQAGKVPSCTLREQVRGHFSDPEPLELVKTTDKKKRRNSVFSLAIAGEGAPMPLSAMIKEADIDPVSQNIRHMDFIRVDMDKTVLSRVPLSFVGTLKAWFWAAPCKRPAVTSRSRAPQGPSARNRAGYRAPQRW